MHCKSSHCECNEAARTACDERLTAAATPSEVYCKNRFCKHGAKCPARSSIDYMQATKGTLNSVLVEMNEHMLNAIRDNRVIDMCYDNARRKVLRALAEKPLEMTRTEQNRLLARDLLLAEIEAEVRPALHSYRDPSRAGSHLLNWLRCSNILRGQRL